MRLTFGRRTAALILSVAIAAAVVAMPGGASGAGTAPGSDLHQQAPAKGRSGGVTTQAWQCDPFGNCWWYDWQCGPSMQPWWLC